jgi:hypothetical protein
VIPPRPTFSFPDRPPYLTLAAQEWGDRQESPATLSVLSMERMTVIGHEDFSFSSGRPCMIRALESMIFMCLKTGGGDGYSSIDDTVIAARNIRTELQQPFVRLKLCMRRIVCGR